MNKSDLEKLAELRLLEAKVLLASNNFPGAYYLAGYALECSIKACIAKQVGMHDFPNKKLADGSYSHDLQKLIGVAGLTQQLGMKERDDAEFSLNWAVAKDWSEQSRYEHNIEHARAKDLLDAVSDERSGVLTWLKTFW